MWDPYTKEVSIVKPADIGVNATRGWIDSNGTVFSSGGSHDDILRRIIKSDTLPPKGSGWIRWIGSVSGTLFMDWSEYGNANSENLVRAVTKQIHHPFKQIWVDALDAQGVWYTWKGSVDDFIKFGAKGRRTQFESKLEKILNEL